MLCFLLTFDKRQFKKWQRKWVSLNAHLLNKNVQIVVYLIAAISIFLNKFIFNVHFSVHLYFKRSQHDSIQSIQKYNRTWAGTVLINPDFGNDQSTADFY